MQNGRFSLSGSQFLYSSLQREKYSLLLISALAATIAFFTANSAEQLIHIGGSPLAVKTHS